MSKSAGKAGGKIFKNDPAVKLAHKDPVVQWGLDNTIGGGAVNALTGGALDKDGPAGGESSDNGAAAEDMLGTPPSTEDFPTRPQNTQNRYRSGGLAAGDSDSDSDKLGAPTKKKAASRAILG